MLSGFFTIFSSTIGIIRSKCSYNKIHFLSLGDGLGILLFSVGIILANFNFHIMLKISLFLIIYFIGSTTSGYILGTIKYKYDKSK
ncbi:monovalent cation/H(+) antiporter subunit G [Anaplasmataceae bacterium AB001_6]|nr:monovalent cation/H(+) antiporter subunit G [Anaplasmataceae bacterium AB001_6]